MHRDIRDGSYILTYFHDLQLKIGGREITAPIGFSERLGVGFNILGRTGIFDKFSANPPLKRIFHLTLDKLALKSLHLSGRMHDFLSDQINPLEIIEIYIK